MPKKRFSSQFSKPASTVHPSLNSNASASTSASQNNNVSSVNDLINSARRLNISPTEHLRAASSLSPSSHTLPPQIRHLLSQPETPSPTPRRPLHSRRLDANGRRIPAGPAPPRSWLEESIHAPSNARRRFRLGEEGKSFSRGVGYFPGLGVDMNGNGPNGGRSLLGTCLRRLASDWQNMNIYESNNLAMLPVSLRMGLLSYIAVYGPKEGIGFQGLKNILLLPLQDESVVEGPIKEETEDWEEEADERSAGGNNDYFFRLDLGGSIGRSVSLKQLATLLTNTSIIKEETIPRFLPIALPHLTHLSLSHPPPSISWSRLLALTPHLKTVTHLSLAYWPPPTFTANSSTNLWGSPTSRRSQFRYVASSLHSQIMDENFSESALVLKKLASGVYGLEYLDLEGCIDWTLALQDLNGVDWAHQWRRLKTLILKSGMMGDDPDSDVADFVRFSDNEYRDFAKALVEGLYTKDYIHRMRRTKALPWMDVIVDRKPNGAKLGVTKESFEGIVGGGGARNGDTELAMAIAHSTWES